MKIKEILYMYGFATMALIVAFFASPVQATYVYEASQNLYDLQSNSSGSTGLGSNDDSVSSAFNLGFTFTFYGENFTQARMATNGCLHFKTSGAYCNDYTPDPLTGQHTYTLYPFWTDLIKDNGSGMRAKAFADYTIFGWYKMREYNQSNTDNSFEVWLYPNNTFEYRYRELDIDNHDVLIGEIGSGTSEAYTYYYHDECNTGSTNASNCVSINWNSIAMNSSLENGGSLYGVGTGNALDCSSALNNAACPGYAAAYLLQQCDLNSLYSETCSGYANAYDDQQCGLDSQYAPFCAGYTTTSSVAYYDETDYGYDDTYADDQYGYDDNYLEDSYYEDDYYEENYEEDQYADNCVDNPDWCYEDDPYWDQDFTDEEWYAIDLEEFGQEQVDEWYGTEVDFSDEGYIEWDSSELNTWDELDEQMDQYDEIFAYDDYEEEIFVEDIFYDEYERTSDTVFYEDDYFETDYTYAEHDLIEIFDANEILEEFEFLTITSDEYMDYEEEAEGQEFETIEELEEWYEEEIQEEFEEEYYAEEETFQEELYAEEVFEEEAVTEIYEEIEELLAEEVEETTEEIELELVVNEEPSNGGIRSEQLNVVADSVRAATNSVSGTTSGAGSISITYGTSSQSTGNTVASGGASSVATGGAASGVTSAGVSTTSSPSISDQFASASAQTQQVLALSPSTAVSSDLSSAGTDFSTSVVSTSTMSTDSSIEAAETIASTDATASVSTGESVASTSSTESIASTDTSSTSSGSSTEVTITPMPGIGGQSQVAMVDVQVQGVTSEIDTATTGVMTASEADQIADQIIADNIEQQQQQVAASAEESGEYGDQTTLVAYIGFNPNFTDYYSHVLPQKTDWYEPREIYANARISDNVSAFYDMAGTSLRTIRGMINSQPNLLGE